MNKLIKTFTLLLACQLILSACATSPTGRKQLKLFPSSHIESMGVTTWAQLQEKTPSSTNRRSNAYVSCVSNAVLNGANIGGQWEVNVFDDEAVNAFALPGRKIGVYTGILKVAKNQHQLAAVIGHEIAHVTADHGNERVSVAFATQSGLQLAQVMAGNDSPEKQQLFGLLGVGAQVGILLPYGRAQESESDIVGLEYMARAGFDPRQSVNLWQNMAKASKGQPPEFLSTHPGHDTRIAKLKAHMPKVMKLYNQARAQGRIPDCH